MARTPTGESDVEPLRGYVRALEDPGMPEARLSWTNAHAGRIEANLGAGQVVSLQIAWHRGWHARVDGKEIPIARDALGMMTIYAPEGGSTIDLVYDGGVEMRVATWVSGVTALILVGWIFRGGLRGSDGT